MLCIYSKFFKNATKNNIFLLSLSNIQENFLRFKHSHVERLAISNPHQTMWKEPVTIDRFSVSFSTWELGSESIETTCDWLFLWNWCFFYYSFISEICTVKHLIASQHHDSDCYGVTCPQTSRNGLFFADISLEQSKSLAGLQQSNDLRFKIVEKSRNQGPAAKRPTD